MEDLILSATKMFDTVSSFVVTLFVAALGGLGLLLVQILRDDSKELWPWLTKRYLSKAIDLLPTDLKERYREEWQADLNERATPLLRLIAALGLPSAAKAIAKAHAPVLAGNDGRSSLANWMAAKDAIGSSLRQLRVLWALNTNIVSAVLPHFFRIARKPVFWSTFISFVAVFIAFAWDFVVFTDSANGKKVTFGDRMHELVWKKSH